MDQEDIVYRMPLFPEADGGETPSSSSWSTLIVWTLVLGLVGLWWYLQEHPPNESTAFQEERRVKMAEARLRTFQARKQQQQQEAAAITTDISKEIIEQQGSSPRMEVPVVSKPAVQVHIQSDVSSSSKTLVSTSTSQKPKDTKESTKDRMAAPTSETEPETPKLDPKLDTGSETEPEMPKLDPELDTTTATTTINVQEKRLPSKNKKKEPPACQMVCEALSSMLGVSIRVKDHVDSKSWGGVGWWKMTATKVSSSLRRRTTTTTVVELPLYSKYDPQKEQDWEYLCDCLLSELLLVAQQKSHPPVFPMSLRPMCVCYSKIGSAKQAGYSPFLTPGHSGFANFCRLLGQLQDNMVRQMAEWIGPSDDEKRATARTKNREEVEHDLFSDDYDSSVASAKTSTTLNKKEDSSPWETFIELMVKEESPSISISTVLLQQLESHSNNNLASRIIKRLLQELECETSIHNLQRWLTPLSTHAKFLASDWVHQHLQDELHLLQDDSVPGCKVEERLLLTPLIRIAALALEGDDNATTARWTKQLSLVANYPVCVFTHRQSAEFGQYYLAYRRLSVLAQRILESWVKIAMKENKGLVFAWVHGIVSKNKSLLSLAKSELLDREAGSKVSHCFTRAFLLGLAASWINLCCQSLTDRFQTFGTKSFDAVYLYDNANSNLMDFKNGYSLFGHSKENQQSESTRSPSKYSGSTQFFFLASALLRVALHSGLKMEQEYYRHNSRIFDVLRARGAQSEPDPLPSRFRAEAGPKVATWMGWKMFLEEPEFVTNVTNFALLQLKWVMDLARAGNEPFLPDWMVKDPARSLAEIARRTPQLLKQFHAEQAVECCTELLELGYKSFSPIVVACLLRIASAFVYAGVHRARQRQRERKGNRWGKDTQGDEPDDRSLDIYLSFDKHDLGVTVFTNSMVCTRLCPTLIRTFRTLDVVEGLDMDREYDFDKFSAKTEIADLLLRLWSHPNGECRMSIVKSVKPSDFRSFVSSLSTALSVFFDDAVQKLATTLQTMQKGDSVQDQRFIDAHSSSAAGGLLGARRMLLLLCTLSQEERIASAFGGGFPDGDNGTGAVLDLANMVVHFLDILTGDDGGTHPDLELGVSESTFSMFQRESTMSQDEHTELMARVGKSRQFTRLDIGLDVSIVAHQLLALAARWHSSAASQADSPGTSSLLVALSCHDDIDMKRLERIFDRLIKPASTMAAQGPASSFFNDGYKVSQVAMPLADELNDETKRRRQRAKQDQMTHEAIEEMLGGRRRIQQLLEDLRVCVKQQAAIGDAKTQSILSIDEAQRSVMLTGAISVEEVYENELGEFVVSSSPFANPNDTTKFRHYYDNKARSRKSSGSGKALIKEARKCHKGLPTPHINSSCFVCFAEERMDLCRAIVTGPVDTPYAHGLFVFDVYFPPDYPRVPPLVTFMTTGGGQVRFNPNLYVDGKVCLSLLGLTFSDDESQRWNPDQSFLGQILLSMQAQIFGVKEPYFNEGSGIPESQRNTPAGREGSRRHNSMLRLATLRHAIVAQLRSPPLGFEEITQRHFSMCRKRLLAQARRWALEERESPLYPRYERAYAELLQLLSEQKNHAFDSIQPLQGDVEFLKDNDPSFPLIGRLDETKVEAQQETKLAAVISPVRQSNTAEAALNPWANPSVANVSSGGNEKRDSADEDPDDDLYS